MDDEGSQSNDTPRNYGKRGTARDPEKARSDLDPNTHAPPLEHTAQAHLIRAKLSDPSNALDLEQPPYQRATASSSLHVGPYTRPVPVKTQDSGQFFVEVSQDSREFSKA